MITLLLIRMASDSTYLQCNARWNCFSIHVRHRNRLRLRFNMIVWQRWVWNWSIFLIMSSLQFLDQSTGIGEFLQINRTKKGGGRPGREASEDTWIHHKIACQSHVYIQLSRCWNKEDDDEDTKYGRSMFVYEEKRTAASISLSFITPTRKQYQLISMLMSISISIRFLFNDSVWTLAFFKFSDPKSRRHDHTITMHPSPFIIRSPCP